MELVVVKEEIRDAVMNNILSIPSNQSCFDCGNKRPRWASPYLGILICMECAGRHRSYGTHISYVKSVDLDKWNKKQLKSLELTGNFYMKKQFEKLKIPKIESLYDYNNELILKIRKHIENLVKDNLKEEDYSSLEQIKKNENIINDRKEVENNVNLIQNNKEEKEILRPVKFNIKKNDPLNKKDIKKNKIKKLDIDFDFENYNTNNSKNDQIEQEKNIDINKIKGMKLSRIDKKRELIEERKKNKKEKKEKKEDKSTCQKIKECIYYIFCCFRNKN